MKRYDYLKMQHRCVRCSVQDAYTLSGRSYCYECAQRNNANVRKYREKNRDTANEYMNERRNDLRARGLCYVCGKRPAEKQDGQCAVCRHKDAEHKRRKRNFYPDPDSCCRCHKNPRFGEFKVCEKCYMDGLKGSAAADAVRNNRDHPWRKVFTERQNMPQGEKNNG